MSRSLSAALFCRSCALCRSRFFAISFTAQSHEGMATCAVLASELLGRSIQPLPQLCAVPALAHLSGSIMSSGVVSVLAKLSLFLAIGNPTFLLLSVHFCWWFTLPLMDSNFVPQCGQISLCSAFSQQCRTLLIHIRNGIFAQFFRCLLFLKGLSNFSPHHSHSF